MKFSTDVQCMQSTHASFSSFHRFLTGFRSGLAIIAALFSFPWLCVWDHCPAETSIFVSSSSSGQMAADCICTFFLFILPSIIWSTSVPYADKQPHTTRFPPPNLIVGMVFVGWYVVPFDPRIQDNLKLYFHSISQACVNVFQQTVNTPQHAFSSASELCMVSVHTGHGGALLFSWK